MEFPGEKLVLKLWETIAEKGIGTALQPWHEKRLGVARNQVRRDEILMLAEAEKLAAEIKAGRASYSNSEGLKYLAQENRGEHEYGRIEPTLGALGLPARAIEIESAEAIRKEINTSKAIIIAENILANDTQDPPEQAVDDDWLFSWRDYAGKVSSTELQDLWGRVLAGEVKSPGSYSLRALEFLRNLSKEEAELISKAAKFVVQGQIYRNKDTFLQKANLSFSSLLFLQEIGILSGVEAIGLQTTWTSLDKDRYLKALISNNKIILLEHEDIKKEATAEIYMITSVGKQILALASFGSDMDYLLSIAKDYAAQGYKVSVGDWIQVNANSGNILNPTIIEA